MSSKIFENLYLKNAILEFLSGALIAYFVFYLSYSLNDNYVPK